MLAAGPAPGAGALAMRTLSTELGAHADRIAGRSRVYVDANVPAGVVDYMRRRLGWDVLFVVEDDGLRRASDDEHYVVAARLGRTLITLDRDYLDDRRFPASRSPGVIVLAAPNENGLRALLRRVNREFFGAAQGGPLPLERRKLHLHPDWRLETDAPGASSGA
jgi:predicted nuclease of predicted toxin-antitoxin system